jgi:hypothetical protein
LCRSTACAAPCASSSAAAVCRASKSCLSCAKSVLEYHSCRGGRLNVGCMVFLHLLLVAFYFVITIYYFIAIILGFKDLFFKPHLSKCTCSTWTNLLKSSSPIFIINSSLTFHQIIR